MRKLGLSSVPYVKFDNTLSLSSLSLDSDGFPTILYGSYKDYWQGFKEKLKRFTEDPYVMAVRFIQFCIHSDNSPRVTEDLELLPVLMQEQDLNLGSTLELDHYMDLAERLLYAIGLDIEKHTYLKTDIEVAFDEVFFECDYTVKCSLGFSSNNLKSIVYELLEGVFGSEEVLAKEPKLSQVLTEDPVFYIWKRPALKISLQGYRGGSILAKVEITPKAPYYASSDISFNDEITENLMNRVFQKFKNGE